MQIMNRIQLRAKNFADPMQMMQVARVKFRQV